ncbi:hypothetical protein T492DRAFT_590607 [Pavlovales sp. CCMP2436]|nr:hypothetical protein T492DRAFT_590607 [Pavlovales sp. CCMP2436]
MNRGVRPRALAQLLAANPLVLIDALAPPFEGVIFFYFLFVHPFFCTPHTPPPHHHPPTPPHNPTFFFDLLFLYLTNTIVITLFLGAPDVVAYSGARREGAGYARFRTRAEGTPRRAGITTVLMMNNILYFTMISAIILYFTMISAIILYFTMISAIILYFTIISAIILYFTMISAIILYAYIMIYRGR